MCLRVGPGAVGLRLRIGDEKKGYACEQRGTAAKSKTSKLRTPTRNNRKASRGDKGGPAVNYGQWYRVAGVTYAPGLPVEDGGKCVERMRPVVA